MTETDRRVFLNQAGAAVGAAIDYPRKKLVFIVGDALQPMNSIRRFRNIYRSYYNGLRQQGNKAGLAWLKKERSTPEGRDRIRWNHFEYARYISANSLPRPPYYYIHYLSRLGAVDSILTTNYDLFLDSIFSRYPVHRKLQFNPVRTDPTGAKVEGYRSTNSSDRYLRIWKTHGSLNFVSFKGCGRVFRLPNFMISTPDQGRLAFGAFAKRHFAIIGKFICRGTDCPGRTCRNYVHHVDSFYDTRDPFKPEIDCADEHLRSSTHVGSVFLLGFRGGDDEELSKTIALRANSGVKTFAVFSDRQAKHSPLLRKLSACPSFSWAHGSVYEIFGDVIKTSPRLSGMVYHMDGEYFDWSIDYLAREDSSLRWSVNV